MLDIDAGKVEDNQAQSKIAAIGTAVTNGVTIGLLEVLWWVSMLALIFAGPLSIYIGRAAVFIVAGGIVASTIIAFRSSWRGSIGMPQDVPTAILVVVTSRIISTATTGQSLDVMFATIVATVAIASIATGVFMYFLGVFKLGNLVRFLPFPVIAGFLGGTGWLLVLGGLSSSLASGRTADILLPQSIPFWIPTIAVALLIYLIGLKIERPILLPALLVLATGIFFGITVGIMGHSLTELTEAGWLVGALPADLQPQLPSLAEFRTINWGMILAQAGSIAVLVVASSIAMLLNNSGFELALHADLDPNKDLRAHGLANIFAGLVGGWPTYITPAWSSINSKDKRQHPLTGFIAPLISGILLWFATGWFAYLPRFIVGVSVAYLGIIFLIEWVVEPAKRLPRLEYGILLIILLIIAIFGLLEGVAAGLFLAVVLFVVSYSRIEVVRYVMSGLHQQSRVTRVADHRNFLRTVGDEIQILQLQGYIFFGSANRLLENVREIVAEQELSYLLLDFERVSGIDSTALLSFSKMQKLLERQNTALMLTSVSTEAQEMIEQEIPLELTTNLTLHKSLDAALQTAEDQQLINHGFDPATPVPSFEEQISKILPDAKNIPQLLELLEVQELEHGHYLMHAGDEANDMFFVKEGGLTAQLEREDGSVVRLESMSMGRSVGELGFYLNQKRTAAVVSSGPSVVYRLTKDNLAKIEQDHPDVASTIHRLIVNLLSDRVTHLVGVVDVLHQ